MIYRPVCVKDKIEYKSHKDGVFVFEMARAIPVPHIYQIWHADAKICPVCKHVVVVGFGTNPIFQHHQEGFKEKVALIRAKETVIECYEYPEDVPNE